MGKLLLGIILLTVASITLAATATTVPFADNSTVHISASTANINRLFIKGDKITQHVAPVGTFIFDKRLSEDGSLYFKPVYLTTPFTLFLTTKNGHHVSLVVTPTNNKGQTIELTPNSVTTAQTRWERNSGYLHLLQTTMLAMIRGKAPKGMHSQAVTHAPTVAYSAHLQLRLTRVVAGGLLTGLVYTLTNTSKYAFQLAERRFWHPGVRAVSVSEQRIAAHGHIQVFVITSHGQ